MLETHTMMKSDSTHTHTHTHSLFTLDFWIKTFNLQFRFTLKYNENVQDPVLLKAATIWGHILFLFMYLCIYLLLLLYFGLCLLLKVQYVTIIAC